MEESGCSMMTVRSFGPGKIFQQLTGFCHSDHDDFIRGGKFRIRINLAGAASVQNGAL